MLSTTGAQNQRVHPRYLALFISLLTFATTGCNVISNASPSSQGHAAIAIAVVPEALTVHAGHTAQLAARVDGTSDSGVVWSIASRAPQVGSISPAGVYTAPAGLTRVIHVSVVATSTADPKRSAFGTMTITPAWALMSVTPQDATIQAGGKQQFLANVVGLVDNSVTWSLTSTASQPGVISSTGLYSAPSTLPAAMQVTVTATSVADPSQSASTVLNVLPGASVHVSVSPSSATTQAGATQQFTATVTGATNPSVTWSVTSSAPQPGTISSSGFYIAPSTLSSSIQVTVTATSVADPTQSGSALLTVNPAASVHVSVAPQSATLQAGGTQQLTATVTGTNNAGVTWSISSAAAQAGSISTSGLYTAPSSLTNSIQVTATATSVADPTQSASALLTVNPAVSVHVSVSPQAATVQAGGTQLLTASVTGTNNRVVTWSLSSTAPQAGNISSLGLYTAPSSLTGSIQVTATATSAADPSQSASALLTVVPAATVHVSVTPPSETLQPGATQQFSANVTGTSDTTVTWSMSPQFGTLSTSGLYAAPPKNSSNVQVSVVATSAADPTQSATAIVTVLPASVVSISISPTSLTMASGSSQQFAVAVTGTTNTAVSWSASLGSVSGGLYSAPVTSVQENAIVTATSVADPTQKASAAISVTPQANPGSGVAASFFGLHVNTMNSPWPTVPFASYRTLNSDYIKWSDINTADQTYYWADFDRWMARAESHGQDILYTLYTTPTWASTRGAHTKNPNYTCVYWDTSGPGACDPPNDLNADGTGTDQHWKDFITAVTNHVGPGKIKYWEIWNEFNNNIEWTGTQAQMLRMAKDAYTIIKASDSNAQVTTPSVSSAMFAADNWVRPYLQAGGGDYADIIAVHGYVHLPSNVCPASCPDPQIVATILDKSRAAMAASGQQNKPLFDTEGSWGEGTQMTDPDMQAAFTGRFFLIQAAGTATSKGFDKFYWYGWDFQHSGQFYSLRTSALTPSGVAYQQLYNWLLGAAQTGCSALGTRWTCPMTRAGYQAEAIWDSSQTCSKGTCSTINVTVPPTYVQYRDLAGNVTTISNNTVPVGLKPILLESGNAPAH